MRRKQSGVFLVSAAIAVAVVGALIAFWGAQQARQMRTERAERIGESLKIIGNAVETFTVKYHSDIDKFLGGSVAGTLTINGVEFSGQRISADKTRLVNLTGESLIRVLKLTGVSATPPPGVGDYVILVDRTCENKVSCRIETLTYLSEPIKKTYSTDADLNLATIAARKIGAYGGVSMDGNFRFMGHDEGILPIANPDGHRGLLAIRGGSQTKDLNNTYMRDGSRGMTGDVLLKSLNATGAEVRHNIVGARDIQGSGVLSMGSLDVGKASIKGTLDLGGGDDSKPNNDIVGAGDIVGSGRLLMNELKVESANVGSLTAKGSATIDGPLNLKQNDIKDVRTFSASKEVTAGQLKSKSGVVVLDEAVTEGSKCDVWGIGRDARGRILSCQGGSGDARKWKLSSTPQTVTEVPKTIREEIERVVRVGEGWKMSVLSVHERLGPGVRDWGNLYFRARSRHSTLMACALARPTPKNGIIVYAGSAPIMPLGHLGYIVGPTGTEELICLSKGTGDVEVEAFSWTWGSVGAPGQLFYKGSRHWGRTLGEKRLPMAVYDDTHPEFRPRLVSLLTSLTLMGGGMTRDWVSQPNVLGTKILRRSYKSQVIGGALSCESGDRDPYGALIMDYDDKSTGYPKIGVHTSYVEMICAFKTERDLNQAGFRRCSGNCLPA